MKYATVCSGIEACSAAWEPLGWKPVFFSEIEKYQSAVLAHHYPTVPNLGDMTKINGYEYTNAVDVFCGGTPCQSFSIAGMRGGLADERGNLALTFCRLVDQIRPKWVIWENVPGVLSSNKGRDFGAILGALGELGYGFAYRVLDAQYFGVPQRRRRVFVVGHIGGGWAAPAQVLFEPESVCGHIAPRRGKGERVAAYAETDFGTYSEGVGTLRKKGGHVGGGGETIVSNWPADISPTLDASFGRLQGADNQSINNGAGLFVPVIFNPYPGKENRGLPSSKSCHTLDRSHVPAVAYMGGIDQELNHFTDGQPCGTLTKGSPTGGGKPLPAIYAFPGNWVNRKPENGGNGCNFTEIAPTLTKMDVAGIITNAYVRRITPKEAERLQGFPDNYTAIHGAKTPDTARYQALGNSMAVPVMRWIGERIQKVEDILNKHLQ